MLSPPLSAEDRCTIEHATTLSTAPRRLVEDDGWLLAASDGFVGRANSVAMLAPAADRLDAKIERALAFYAGEGLRPAFRVVEPAEAALAAALAARGLTPQQRTRVLVADLGDVLAATAEAQSAELTAFDEDWAAVFTGPGFAAADGRSRAETLARAPDMLLARAVLDGRTAAVGALALGLGWGGLNGMRTTVAARRQGLARGVIGALARAAEARGVARLYLSVEADNEAAIRLYEGVGWRNGYAYAYWRPALDAAPATGQE